jgi:hypothetical protein
MAHLMAHLFSLPACARCLAAAQEATELSKRASKCAAAFGERMAQIPAAMPQLAASLHLLTLGHPRQVGGAVWYCRAAAQGCVK